MEARSQLHSTAGLMGALVGTSHPALGTYGRFLRQYDRLFTRLESEIDQVYDRRLGPSLVTFHVQLAWRNWCVVQLDANETVCLDPPDFTQGLNMLEIQNNLMWLPTVTNIPALSALHSLARQPAAATPFWTPIQVPAPISGLTTEAAAPPRRDPGRQVRNPARQSCFVGKTPFGRNVRYKAISSAIADAGAPPPMVVRAGVTGPLCVSWHAKGQCVENCPRVADHGVLNASEAAYFQAWCALAYA
jgi:hypothetical protein